MTDCQYAMKIGNSVSKPKGNNSYVNAAVNAETAKDLPGFMAELSEYPAATLSPELHTELLPARYV
jgi:hypothetical protein